MISGQNTILNQYVPTFFIKDLLDGQSIVYDSSKKAFKNAFVSGGGGGGGGATKLGELTNVSPNVDNLLAVQNGQGLVWNGFIGVWENKFTDYNTLLNRPTTTSGTVTSLAIIPTNGISGTVSNPTTTPAITLSLGNIVPGNVSATGIVTGSNLIGINTGDQVITLNGDVTGTGTTTFNTTLATVNLSPGTYGGPTQVPVFTVDLKGRITSISNSSITAGTGTVTSVSASGGSTGLTLSGGPITTTGTITLGGTLSISNGGTGSGSANGALNALLPLQTGNFGKVLSTDGNNTAWTTVSSGSGTVTSVAVSSANSAITVGSSPITTSGTITLTANTFGTGSAGIVPASGGGTTNFLRADGTWSAPPGGGGSGTVTSASVVSANGFAGTVATATTTPAITLSTTVTGLLKGNGTAISAASAGTDYLTPTGSAASLTSFPTLNQNTTGSAATLTTTRSISASGDATWTVNFNGSANATSALTLATVNGNVGTFGSATQVPVFTVNAKGLVTGVTNTTITGGGSSNTASVEIVVFNYSSGSGGNFNIAGALYSQTAGVSTNITDAVNCIAQYTFTGKSNPPRSITCYGQAFASNNFVIKDITSLPSPSIAGGNVNTAPDIANGIFSTSNILQLQTRMSDVSASASIGQRAWLVVVFGF